MKKANGQILSVSEIFEKHPTTIKNFGIWVRFQSRTGYHNMYKEYRDVTLNGAVEQVGISCAWCTWRRGPTRWRLGPWVLQPGARTVPRLQRSTVWLVHLQDRQCLQSNLPRAGWLQRPLAG